VVALEIESYISQHRAHRRRARRRSRAEGFAFRKIRVDPTKRFEAAAIDSAMAYQAYLTHKLTLNEPPTIRLRSDRAHAERCSARYE
jgi:hypothetical protein